MSVDTFRTAIVVVNIALGVAFIAATTDIMSKHPCIPWYIFGIITVLGIGGIGFLIYSFVSHTRKN